VFFVRVKSTILVLFTPFYAVIDKYKKKWYNQTRAGDELNDFKVNTGGLRNEKPLTQKQINEAIEYAVKLGMPRYKITYGDNYLTSHSPISDILLLGTDLYPAENIAIGTKNANARVSWKSTIGHEIVGHREAALKGWTQINPILEETQASIRAARFTPDLNETERITLLRDAVTRLPDGVEMKDIKNILNISER